jgi:hypothetical protein
MDKIISPIEHLMNEDVLNFLIERGGWIAGGALTSSITRSEINDIDIYLRTPQDIKDFILEMGHIIHHSEKSITFQYFVDGVAVLHQLITLNTYETPQEIFNNFDFTINMIAWEPKTGKLEMHPECLLHASQRCLCFNEDTLFPFVSLARVQKYQQRGYTISTPNLMKIGLSCANTNISSWDELEHQLAGMYGEELDLEEYEDKEYSLELSMELLTNTKKVYKSKEDMDFNVCLIGRWGLSVKHSGLKPEAWLSSNKDKLFVEDGDYNYIIKAEDGYYKAGKEVLLGLECFDVQEKSFKDRIGKWLYDTTNTVANKGVKYLNRTPIKSRWASKMMVRVPETGTIRLHTWEEDDVVDWKEGDFLKVRPIQIRICCEDEARNIRKGIFLHEMAYPEYVEERERMEK